MGPGLVDQYLATGFQVEDLIADEVSAALEPESRAAIGQRRGSGGIGTDQVRIELGGPVCDVEPSQRVARDDVARRQDRRGSVRVADGW